MPPTAEELRRRLRLALQCSLPSNPHWRDGSGGSSGSAGPAELVSEPLAAEILSEPAPATEEELRVLWLAHQGAVLGDPDAPQMDAGSTVSTYNSRPSEAMRSIASRSTHWTGTAAASSLPTDTSGSPHGTLQHDEAPLENPAAAAAEVFYAAHFESQPDQRPLWEIPHPAAAALQQRRGQ